MSDFNDDDLLAELGVEVAPLKASSHTPREERIIAGFEDILRFYDENGRAPQHGENRDIFERLYAVRLDQLRKLPEAKVLLANFDTHGLLSTELLSHSDISKLDEDALLAELGVTVEAVGHEDITVLRHVRPYVEIKAAEEMANRTRCEDFESFKPLFDTAMAGLKAETWITKPYLKNAGIQVGDFFILGGQVAYVAEMHGDQKTKDGRDNPRMRVIFDNQTESNLLLRSLARALYPDVNVPVGRRLVPKDDGPLFSGNPIESDDVQTGTIYILRSNSNHPFIAEHRELIHKIGVTGGKVETRINGAENDATYLLAGVDVVATYTVHNVNRNKLEAVFHKLFSSAQIDISIEDRFGHPVKPREWFLVPINVIDEAVKRVIDGSITKFIYDTKTAMLVRL